MELKDVALCDEGVAEEEQVIPAQCHGNRLGYINGHYLELPWSRIQRGVKIAV
jgi:hypothetical protein